MQLFYDDHFTTFIDILGFAHAAQGPDRNKVADILELLVSFCDRKQEPAVTNAGLPMTCNVRPCITTFSDNLVISYRLNEICWADVKEQDTVRSVLWDFKARIAGIAAEALSKGFLIRGGACISELYHGGGVVFGRAMVEAYELESEIAFYPRVILSKRITDYRKESPTFATRSRMFLTSSCTTRMRSRILITLQACC